MVRNFFQFIQWLSLQTNVYSIFRLKSTNSCIIRHRSPSYILPHKNFCMEDCSCCFFFFLFLAFSALLYLNRSCMSMFNSNPFWSGMQ
ncbi:hypothetical protein J3R30DRAFT_3451424 [Lentinula aciculospora]|uniref:Uncharacterized protein n=1 Tax=Lentinula aciculospora TaxID=153920 RepID=A0A9W9DTK1_9AGAR|nr:hypothetical protein J3R30DRAFT_3451424 [Lentinula aciculospora]